MLYKKIRIWPAIEFFCLCIGFPGLIVFGGYGKMMFLFLWSAAIYCALIYRINLHSRLRYIWHWDEVNWKNLRVILIRWLVACVAIYLFTLWYDPEKLFRLFEHGPVFIISLAFGYTLLSALPQEFIFCTFFFRRYAQFFGRHSPWIILASATVFGYAHALYANPVAPIVSFIGGLIFAHTYSKTRSLALITIEHGLYGMALFLIGLGHYFYSGAIGQN